MIDLKELDAKSEDLMNSLANKDEDLIDLVLTPQQKSIGMSKSLAYIASLVISPDKVPPYSKEEERMFARLQILYQQKKLTKPNELTKKHKKRPQLFKLSPVFAPKMPSKSETQIEKNKKQTKTKGEMSKEEIRRLGIIEELLANEENEKRLHSKKSRKKSRKQSQRVITDQNLPEKPFLKLNCEKTSSEKNFSISPNHDYSDKNDNQTKPLHFGQDLINDCNSGPIKSHSNTNPISSNYERKSTPTHLSERSQKKDMKETESDTCQSEIDATLFKNEVWGEINRNLYKSETYAPNNSLHRNICVPDQPNSANATQSEQKIKEFENSASTMLEDSLRKEVLRLQSELNRSKVEFEKRLLMERKQFEKKLEEALRAERENSEQRFQALQLRLFISDNRAQTLEDALDEHIAAVSHLPRRKQKEGIGDTIM